MSLRFQALNSLTHTPPSTNGQSAKITAIFAENVFTQQVARQFLSDEAFKSLINSTKTGQKIDRAMAAQIANGIRAWAESKGVSHFTHWFQPLTGTTAEKHDSFFTIKAMARLSSNLKAMR
jgi:glutamine synthetase